MPSAKCLTAHPAPTKPTLPLEVYLQAVDQADLAISITDPAANILFANETFTRVTGYALGEVVGNNESMLSNRTTPREVYQSMWTALMERRPWSGKLLNRKKSGQLYLAELTISPVMDEAGTVTHYLGMHRDITEFHRLEQMVRNQKALIESVVDAAPIAIALLDRKGRVLLDNQAYKKLVTDLRVSEPAHTLLDSVLAGWRGALSDDIAGCVFDNREARVDHRNGRPRWLSVTASTIQIHSDSADNYFASSDQPGLLLVISDVTSLRAEQERARTAALQAAMAEEERTAALREGLSAAIFRLEEPMNVMASAVSILQRRDPSSADLLKHALAAGREHMESLRQVIPPSAPEMVFSVNLNELLRDVLEVCTPRLLRAGIVVDWHPATTLPPLLGRPLQLRMLFKALVDNAIEAMDAKGWKRRELTLATSVKRACMVVTVTDSGPGIPPELRHRAFEPFFSAKTGAGRHLGTGLSRAQQIVSDHGGIIDLEESPGGGCHAVVEFRLDGDPI